MVVGSKGWSERVYIRELKDVQGTSNTSRILKDIQEALFPVEYRRTDEVPTVATSKVLRFECLSRCYSTTYSRNVEGSTLRVPVEVLFHGAYSRNVGGSTLRVPVEVLFQCLQSQRRRFYACRGAIPRRLSSQRRRFYAPSLKCHIRRDFKDTGHVAQHSAIPSFVRIRTKTNQLHNDRVVRFVVERGLLHRRFQSPTYNFGDEMK